MIQDMINLENSVKLQQFFENVSVLQLCKFNTNCAIEFYKCSGKKILMNVYKKMWLKI